MREQQYILNPRKALNKAFLKVKPNRSDIEKFKDNLTHLLDSIDDDESRNSTKTSLSIFSKKHGMIPAISSIPREETTW
jgi:adenine-specific DNA-methyltransferase